MAYVWFVFIIFVSLLSTCFKNSNHSLVLIILFFSFKHFVWKKDENKNKNRSLSSKTNFKKKSKTIKSITIFIQIKNLRWNPLAEVVGLFALLLSFGEFWILQASLSVCFDAGVDEIQAFLNFWWDWWRCGNMGTGCAETIFVGCVFNIDFVTFWCFVWVFAVLHQNATWFLVVSFLQEASLFSFDVVASRVSACELNGLLFCGMRIEWWCSRVRCSCTWNLRGSVASVLTLFFVIGQNWNPGRCADKTIVEAILALLLLLLWLLLELLWLLLLRESNGARQANGYENLSSEKSRINKLMGGSTVNKKLSLFSRSLRDWDSFGCRNIVKMCAGASRTDRKLVSHQTRTNSHIHRARIYTLIAS